MSRSSRQMNASLVIQQHIAPPDKWHWIVIFYNGHIYSASKSFDDLDSCITDASVAGRDDLMLALLID